MYFVKLKIKYAENGLFSTVVIKSNNSTPAKAAVYAVTVASSWQDVSTVDVIEVSPRPMILQKFIIVVRMYYPAKAAKEMKIHITEENEEKAALLLDGILQDWTGWKEYEVVTIIQQKTKQW